MKTFLSFIFVSLWSFSLFAMNCKTDFLPKEEKTSFTKSAIYKSLTWETGSTLHVHFLDGSKLDKWWVRLYAKKWMKHANLKFKFYQGKPQADEPSHIRITFNENGNWSYIGTSNNNIPRDKATMSLEEVGYWYTPWFAKRRTVLHEFGHAIGLAHEHRSPAFPYTWNEPNVLKWCESRDWDENKCRRNILNPLNSDQVHFWDFDINSVMLYSFSKNMTIERKKLKWNCRLSEEDKMRIAQMYP